MGGTKGRIDIDALVAELRKYARPPFDRAALYIKPLNDAADALERQQAVVEAARGFLTAWKEAEPAVDAAIQMSTIHGMPYKGRQIGTEVNVLEMALAALDAPPEGNGTKGET